MNYTRIIYLLLLVLALLLSFFTNKKKDSSLKIFPYLLSISLITEILVYSVHAANINYNIIYHIYISIEYSLLTYYFYLNNRGKRIRSFILYSIPAYIIISLIISILLSFNKHPSIQINLEGILLITWAIITLFSIDVKNGSKITALPVFWICIAILIYHSGIFTFTGIFNYILEKKSSLGATLNFYILQTSNYILYICLSIAFICSLRIKK